MRNQESTECLWTCNWGWYVIRTTSFLVLGMSNTAGTLAAIVGTVGAGFFVELVGSFQGFLLLTSLLYFLSSLFYILFSTGERVNFDEPGQYHVQICWFFEFALFLGFWIDVLAILGQCCLKIMSYAHLIYNISHKLLAFR